MYPSYSTETPLVHAPWSRLREGTGEKSRELPKPACVRDTAYVFYGVPRMSAHPRVSETPAVRTAEADDERSRGSGHVRTLVGPFGDAGLGSAPHERRDRAPTSGTELGPARDEVVIPSGPSVSHREDGAG